MQNADEILLMDWIECVSNPESLRSLFDHLAGLEAVDVHEVALHRDGPSIRIRADLARFPDRPPSRWPTGANRAQITLSLYGVADLMIEGIATRNVGILQLTPMAGPRMRLEFLSSGLRVIGTCDFARVDHISGYVDAA